MDKGEKAALLRFILESNPGYLDTATVYGEGTERINPILGQCRAELSSEVTIVNKIGADLVDGGDLGRRAVREFEQGLSELGKVDLTLVHRASNVLIERDLALHEAVRSASQAFGICTNSSTVLETYSSRMQIDVLQVALNLLDYQSALPVLYLAKEKGIRVMARSALSSGLLGGRYGPDDVEQFSDELRRRYRDSASNRAIYDLRMEKIARIRAYHEELRRRGGISGSLAAFCYLAIRQSPFVDSVVLGGSTEAQLRENLALPTSSLPQAVADETALSKTKEWSAPYL